MMKHKSINWAKNHSGTTRASKIHSGTTRAANRNALGTPPPCFLGQKMRGFWRKALGTPPPLFFGSFFALKMRGFWRKALGTPPPLFFGSFFDLKIGGSGPKRPRNAAPPFFGQKIAIRGSQGPPCIIIGGTRLSPVCSMVKIVRFSLFFWKKTQKMTKFDPKNGGFRPKPPRNAAPPFFGQKIAIQGSQGPPCIIIGTFGVSPVCFLVKIAKFRDFFQKNHHFITIL